MQTNISISVSEEDIPKSGCSKVSNAHPRLNLKFL